MSRNQFILVIIGILALGTIASTLIWGMSAVSSWLSNQAGDIILAAVLAVVVGLLIEFLYNKFSPQSKMLKATQTHIADNKEALAQLNLPNNNNIIVDGAEKIIGREDFLGVVSSDKLYFIGKDHFRITREDGYFYIEDLKTKNGTTVNGEELHEEKRRLDDGDEILVAKSLRIKYNELWDLK